MKKKETVSLGMVGIWWDRIYRRYSDGKVKLIKETEKNKNTIMDKLADLIAGLFKNESTFSGGILYHALGNGNPAWDSQPSPPSPDKSDELLINEYFRKAPDVIEYIDDLGNPTVSITNRVRLKTTIDFSEANGEWIREQAVYGGDATTSFDSGHIFNIIRHTKIRKEDNIKLERYIQFSINIL